MRLHFVAIITTALMINCNSEAINWVCQGRCCLNANDQTDLLHLAKSMGFGSIYEVEIGVFGKYDSSIAAVAKQVAFVNDTLQQEKWLYLWKREWTRSQLFRSFGDSSYRSQSFVTGQKSIRNVKKFIYTAGNRKKVFQFTTSNGSYVDVKIILDCIQSGSAIEGRMGFKKEAGENWDFVKKNVLDFKSVMYWGKYYAFEYEFPQLQYPHVGFNAKRNGDSCEIISFNWIGSGN